MKWLCHLALFAALAGAGLLCSCKKADGSGSSRVADNAVTVTVAPVTLVPLDHTLPVVGTLFAKDEATLGAEVEGRVERTMAEFGDRLTNGQVIALIDTTTYEAKLHQATANLARAQSAMTNAGLGLARTRQLRADNIASEADLDKATADDGQARADVQAREADEALARLDLERSRVKAPFDCAVSDRIATAGDFMKVGSPLFRVVNDGVLKYIVNAPERFAADVQKEQPVVFNVDAYPGQSFTGRVYLISPQVNTATRALPFGALVPNPDRKLRANTFARGELVLERNVPTPVVPLEAVVNFAGVTKVFVVENGAARSRAVQVGRIQNGRQEVLAGVKSGETVVTSGQTKLFDGTKVRVKAQ